jgi:hypothetical protein
MSRPEENPIEDTIQQTLAGLRNAPVPEGLERRILHTLEDREAVQTRPRRFTNLAWGTAAACGLATIVAAALFFSAGLTATHRPAKQEDSSATQRPSGNTSKESTVTVPPATPYLASTERLNPVRRPRLRHASAPVPDHAEVAASGNSRPVNIPPPPLPLTHQERLLLEIAHRRPPFELAMLTSARREAQEQHDRSEFEQFFGPTEAELETERLNNSQPSEQGKP